MTTGSRLKAVRCIRGLSTRKICEPIGLSQNAISNYESDKFVMTKQVNAKLSEFLGVSTLIEQSEDVDKLIAETSIYDIPDNPCIEYGRKGILEKTAEHLRLHGDPKAEITANGNDLLVKYNGIVVYGVYDDQMLKFNEENGKISSLRIGFAHAKYYDRETVMHSIKLVSGEIGLNECYNGIRIKVMTESDRHLYKDAITRNINGIDYVYTSNDYGRIVLNKCLLENWSITEEELYKICESSYKFSRSSVKISLTNYIEILHKSGKDNLITDVDMQLYKLLATDDSITNISVCKDKDYEELVYTEHLNGLCGAALSDRIYVIGVRGKIYGIACDGSTDTLKRIARIVKENNKDSVDAVYLYKMGSNKLKTAVTFV